MKGEFSRLSFDPRRHFAGVLSQQGRVGLDSDWNEWVEQVLYRLKTETIDVIGQCGRPLNDQGFLVSITYPGGLTKPSLNLSNGRLYAGGLMAELDQTTDFYQQIDWPIPSLTTWKSLVAANANLDSAWPGLDFSNLNAGGQRTDLIYAEVWLRHLTALNDEVERNEAYLDYGGKPPYNQNPEVGDFIRERALGGPDTCTRLQTVAQVKIWPSIPAGITDCPSACAQLDTQRPLATTGALQVSFVPIQQPQDPCDEPLTGGYGGAENRVYRVEIHDPGAVGKATFKWSNENGAFTVPLLTPTAPQLFQTTLTLTVTSIGNDQRTQLSNGDWVELCGNETELGMFRNNLVQLSKDPTANTDGTWTVSLSASVTMPRAPFLRRWSAGLQIIALNQAFSLDTPSGLQITFSDTTGSGSPYFHDLDYWVWAARTDSRDIEPPDILNLPQPVRGIERSYCCLALVTWTAGATSTIANPNVTGSVLNCPISFPPLTELEPGGCCCCSVTVGDGKISQGEYSDLASAFAALLPTGGIVCIEPGNYTLDQPITINTNNVIVRGCDANLVQLNAPNGAFIINGSQVAICGLAISGGAFALQANSSDQLAIRGNQMQSSGILPAVQAIDCTNLTIQENRIQPTNRATPALSIANAGGARIVGNLIKTYSACAVQVTLSSNVTIKDNQIGMISPNTTASLPVISVQGATVEIAGNDIGYGALELPAGSAGIQIRENTFHNGPSLGISLGALIVPATPPNPNTLQQIEIIGNSIASQEGPGIGTTDLTLTLLELRIEGNLIQQCCNASPGAGSNPTLAAIAIGDVEHLEILNNRIEDNGGQNPGVTGILVAFAAGLRVHGNRITGNFGAGSGPSPGITLAFIIPPPPSTISPLAYASQPAISVCGNVVEAFMAPALTILGLGPMTILDNRLVSLELPDANPALGATVTILNFGIGIGYLELLVRLTGYHANSFGHSNYELNPLLLSFAVIGGEVIFSRNQCSLVTDASNGPGLTSLFLVTLDDLAVDTNQSRCECAPRLLGTDGCFAAATLRIANNRFSEPYEAVNYSFWGFGMFVSAIGNQAANLYAYPGTNPTPSALLSSAQPDTNLYGF